MGARPYLAFKNLLELITQNRATAVGARIRAEPETFIEYARVAVCPLCVQLLPKLMQCRELTRRAISGHYSHLRDGTLWKRSLSLAGCPACLNRAGPFCDLGGKKFC
jgi:hypothetical protein